VHNVSLIQ